MLPLLASLANAGPCPATVADLPASALFERADGRLSGGAVVVILKALRRAMLYTDGVLATLPDSSSACWPVALAPGYTPGHKQRRGDLKTPEGWYRTSDRPWSMFAHALTVHYPGPADAERGLRDGLVSQAERDAIVAAAAADRIPPEDTRLGGQILLHSGGSSPDWTLGCVAFDEPDIVALRALLPSDLRTDVLILP